MARIGTNVELISKDEVYAIVGAAMEVHNQLGSGFAEAVYHEALMIEFRRRGIPYEKFRRLTISYKGEPLSSEYVADLVCFESVVVELKAIRHLSGREEAQVLNYLKAAGLKVGVLIDFGDPDRLIWHRFVN